MVSNYSIQGIWYICLALSLFNVPRSQARCIHSLSPRRRYWSPAQTSSSPASWGSVWPAKPQKDRIVCLELIIATRIAIIITVNIIWHKHYLQSVCWESKCITDIKSVGYGQANQAAVQRVSWNDGKQSREKHHQVPKKLQTDGEPSADGTNTHTQHAHK